MKLTSRDCSNFVRCILAMTLGFALAPSSWTQVIQEQSQDSGTSTDLFVMVGSDFVRPGLATNANQHRNRPHLRLPEEGYDRGELTFAYTYEDAGSGFRHSQFGSHTESLGIMKNFGLPKTKRVTGYTWIQLGITSFTGNANLENQPYEGESLGAIVRFKIRSSIWIQETFDKVVTVPWYATASIGYTWSW
jgi:hypothetical protein